MRRYREEHQWRRRPTGHQLTLLSLIHILGHAPLLTGVFYTFHKGEGQAFLQKEPPHKIVQQLLPLKIALDLEPVGVVLLFLHHDVLMVEVEVHRGAQVGVCLLYTSLPSSLTTLLPLALESSSYRPVSVCGTGTSEIHTAFLAIFHPCLLYTSRCV